MVPTVGLVNVLVFAVKVFDCNTIIRTAGYSYSYSSQALASTASWAVINGTARLLIIIVPHKGQSAAMMLSSSEYEHKM
jgi:hypothetical protein